MRARDNPFATARIHRIRYRLPDGFAWGRLIGRLESMRWHGAIVGPEGAGKTTLLEDFAPRLIEEGFEIVWLRLTRGQPRFAPQTWRELSSSLCSQHFLLLDGAEQLSRWAWWRFRVCARAAGGLLITSHRPGLLPTLLNCATTPELLASLVAELLGERPEVHEVYVHWLHQKHCGNVRDALRELYDLWSSRATGSGECPPPDADRRPGRKEFSPLAV
jgi:hypothetical protein